MVVSPHPDGEPPMLESGELSHREPLYMRWCQLTRINDPEAPPRPEITALSEGIQQPFELVPLFDT